MSYFDEVIKTVLKNEGGYVNNPVDSGGPTNYGICWKTVCSLDPEKLSLYGFNTPLTFKVIENMTETQAKAFYKGEFWDKAQFSNILNPSICAAIFDMSVNAGILEAIKCVQRASNAVHGDLILKEDGILGVKTLVEINLNGQSMDNHGNALLSAFRSERAGFYRYLCAKHSAYKIFLEGWINRAYKT